jgi:hypothetical protein
MRHTNWVVDQNFLSGRVCIVSEIFISFYVFNFGVVFFMHLCRQVPLQEQSDVVLLLERTLVSWSLAIDEHDEHEDLRSSGNWSVISYVHSRMELYYSSLSLPM